MKMNNKGFMMAEVVVVSAIVLIALTTLYLSYNNIYKIYNSRVTYYDTNVLYKLAYYRDSLIDSNNMRKIFQNVLDNENIIGLDSYDIEIDQGDKVFLIYNGKENLVDNILSRQSVNQTYKDYISFLSTSTDLSDTNFVLIMEKCEDDNENCRYGYLKIYDGYE